MPQVTKNYVGQRLSFNSSLCTVRFVGLVEGTEGTWLGVEWDDPLIGKHPGSHNGREYFTCRSDSPKAASFIRPRRPADERVGFLQALRNKYYDDNKSQLEAIQISASKVVEEVGFEKIRRAQAMLQTLRIVLLTGQRLVGLLDSPWKEDDGLDRYAEAIREVALICPKVTELDLSGNLLETLLDVAAICKSVPELRSLTLNGNRLRDVSIPDEHLGLIQGAFDSVHELNLDDTLLTWDEIVSLTVSFPSLRILSLATNNLTSTPSALQLPALHTLSLAHNNIASLTSFKSLTQLPSLHTLSLASNAIRTLTPSPTFPSLTSLDLSTNHLLTLSSLTPINLSFPSLTTLRLSRNPFFAALPPDDAHMLSLARLPRISTLNFSDIGPEERENAEMYYLSKIAAELGAVREEDAGSVLVEHPLWEELCRKYGEPVVKRAVVGEARPGTLGARLIRCAVRMGGKGEGEGQGKEGEKGENGRGGESRVAVVVVAPKTVNVYVLKSLIGERFGLKTARFRIVWETGEWDPVRTAKLGKDDDARFEVGDVFENEEKHDGKTKDADESRGRFMRREVEIVEGSSSLGFWIEGLEASLRIEQVET
ncbi:MAG: hypothetical protein MMC23_003955 [Stictis urceolatum]|nr:hypothetical protein [Stictis urceolata]